MLGLEGETILEVCSPTHCQTCCFFMSAIGLRVMRMRWRSVAADALAGSVGVPGVGGDCCEGLRVSIGDPI